MNVLCVDGTELREIAFFDQAFRGAGPKWQVYRVADPYEAVDYLSGFKHYGDRIRYPFPDVVSLSLNSHTNDGLDLLAWLRAEGFSRRLTVLVGGVAPSETDDHCARELAPRAWFARRANWRPFPVRRPWPRPLTHNTDELPKDGKPRGERTLVL